MNVSVVFKERPLQWGMRGDPFLWDDLSKYFDTRYMPYTESQFKREFYSKFFDNCGKELGTEMMTFVPKYARGGMSSGMVSHVFWQDTALPLLIKRLGEIQNVE